MIRIRLTGQAEFAQFIDEVTRVLDQDHVDKTIAVHARPIARRMAARIRPQSGKVARSVRVWRRRAGRLSGRGVFVGSRYGKATGVYHAHWFEYGTRRHVVVARDKQVLATEQTLGLHHAQAGVNPDGYTVFGPAVEVEGMRPTPFVRPEWDASRRGFVEALRRDLGRQVEAARKRPAPAVEVLD